MAFNKNVPLAANQISADLVAMNANWELTATGVVTTAGDIVYATADEVLARLAIGTYKQVLKTNAAGNAPEWALPDIFQRSVFTYNGGATAYTVKCKSATYLCKDKICWWDAELTTGAIGTPAGNTWYYLYLDYSAITSGTEITTTELIWSDTAPSWNTTHKQWMNGDDRCIFAALSNAAPDNILEFFHEGGVVFHADEIAELAATDIDTTWTDIDCASSIPAFATVGIAWFMGIYVDGTSTFRWRTNGQTATTGHATAVCLAGSTRDTNTTKIITDSSQIIEIIDSQANGDQVQMNIQGWEFPIGM